MHFRLLQLKNMAAGQGSKNPLEIFSFSESFQLTGGKHCSCPVPCEEISYQPILSYAFFPNKEFLTELYKSQAGVLEDGAENYTKVFRYLLVMQ